MTTAKSCEVALEQKPLAYSVNGAVAVSNQPRSALYRAIKRGELIARKRGHRTIVLAKDLEAWLGALPVLGGGVTVMERKR